MWLKRKLRGGALYLSLVIGVVISLFLGLMVVLSRYNHTQLLVSEIEQQLYFDVKSGIHLAVSPNFSEQQNNMWISMGKEDSLRVKKMIWGAYYLIVAEGKNGKFKKSAAGLYGAGLKPDTSLVVEDNGRPIAVAGKIEVKSPCYLPSQTMKPAYIEGLSFNGAPQSAMIRKSPAQLPELSEEFVNGITNKVLTLHPETDSLVENLREISKVSFISKTAVLQAGSIKLNNISYSGNIKLIAEEVELDKSAHLEDVLIVADKVRINGGFNGALHIIARDSIIVGDSCVLKYPSSLVVGSKSIQGAATGLKGIYLGENVVIQGNLICYAQKPQGNEVPRCFVKLNKGCEVYGLLYSSGYAHLQGKLFANAYARRLMVKSNSAAYENHWIDTEINPVKHSASLMTALCFTGPQHLKCCKSF